MIGFRGASRYYDTRYRDGFALECRAHEEGARRDGPDQRQDHGAVLPHGRGRRGACIARDRPATASSDGEDGLELT